MRKLIVVGLCSVHDAMNKDQRKPKRQNARRDPRQDEKGPNGLEHRAVPGAGTVRETATRIAAKSISAIAAVQILTRQRVQLLESDHPISFRLETGAAIMKKA
jgi:hypothetical protein